MNMKYRFSSDAEPTDAQLEALMREVITDVIKRRKKADKAYWKLLKEEAKRVKTNSPFRKAN